MQDDQEIPICLQLAYTDKNGNKFYSFKNIGEIPYKRLVSAKVQEHFISMGIDSDMLTKIAKAGIHASQQTITDIEEYKSEMNLLFQNILLRVGYVCSEDLYMRLASCYFLLEGETITEFTAAWFEKKLLMCHDDVDLKGFFLQTAFKLTTNLQDISEQTIANSLEWAKEREKQIPPLKS